MNTNTIGRMATTVAGVMGMATTASLAQTTPPPAEAPWKTTAGIGLTLTDGNSETLLLTADVNTQKKWDRNEFSAGAAATYGEDQDVKNNESISAFAQYNRLFTERIYGLLRVDGLHDAIADVEYRAAISAGAGYYFIKNKTTFLRAEAGPGYVFEKLGSDERDYATIRFGERFEHQLNKTANIWQSAEFVPKIDDWADYVATGEIGISSKLTEHLALRAYLQDVYRSEPAIGREKNDLKLVAGVTYTF